MSVDDATAVELVVRVSLVFIVSAAIALALHRQSASVRHLVWSASLGGSLALAVLVPWSPRMNVPVRGWNVVRQSTIVDSAPALSTAPLAVAPRFSQRSVNQIIDDASTTIFEATGGSRTPPWFLMWLAGAMFVVGWGIIGRLGLARIARRAAPVGQGAWRTAVDKAAKSMQVTRPIRILVSDRVGAPVTWGVRRPVLVVPTSSEIWSESIRRSVAAHEVAHIARNDYLHQLVALAACAVYWFHPLTWALVRRLRLAAERACDDLVLAQGTSGEDYATHLIGVARGSRALRLAGAVAIGMARPSTLEGRIVAVLDPTKRRGEPSSRIRRMTLVAAGVALTALGTLRPVPAAARGIEVLPPVEVTGAPIIEPAPATAVVVPAIVAAAPERSVNVVQDSRNSRAEQGEYKQDVVDARPGEQLELDLTAGGSVRIRSWDENRVQVRTRLGGDDWRDVNVRVDRQSSGVLVEARFERNQRNQSTDNHFEILVPRRFDVRISSAGGNLTITDVDGQFRGHTGGGGLTLERVTGSASLTTGGGEIRVSDSNLSGTVSTGGGTVMLSRVSGGLRGSSGSGPVIYGESGSGSGSDSRSRGGSGFGSGSGYSTNSGGGSGSGRSRSDETSDLSSVNVTGGGSRIDIGRNSTYSAGRLSINKAGGDIDLSAAPNGANVHTGGGDVRIGESGGDVSAHTGGGNVRVGPVSGSVEATTGAGEVHIVVDRVTRDQVIEAWSGKGKIIVELPRDFEGRLELETAYTRTHEGTSRIDSDFEIDREPLTGWDDREGTARRYLRASGRIGRGSARVIIRTVNGEIEIRRR